MHFCDALLLLQFQLDARTDCTDNSLLGALFGKRAKELYLRAAVSDSAV